MPAPRDSRRRPPVVLLAGLVLALAAGMAGGRAFAPPRPLADASITDDGAPADPSGWGGDSEATDTAVSEDADPGDLAAASARRGRDGGRSDLTEVSASGAGRPGTIAPASYVTDASTQGKGARGLTDGAVKPAVATATAAEEPPVEKPPEPQPATLAGRVTDTGGAAIAGAAVKLTSGSKTYHQATSDADGRYRVEKIRPGRYRVVARASGFVDAAAPGTFDLAPAEARVGADVVMRPSGTASGRVVDPDGNPVARAAVSAERGGAYGRIDARTDKEGRFVVRGLPVGRTRLRAEHDDWLPATPVPIEVKALEDGVPGSVEGVRLEVRRGAEIRGRATGASGESVGTWIWLHDSRGRRLERSHRLGEYVFRGLGAGRYVVATERKTGVPVGREEVVLAAGESRRVDLICTAGGSVAGTCVDAAGEPVVGVRVTATLQGVAFSGNGTTAADGRFRVEGLLDGPYAVSAAPAEMWAQPEPLAAAVGEDGGPQDLVLLLEPAGVLAGRAIARDGGTAGAVRVTVTDPAGRTLGSAEADPAGRFRFGHLPPGDAEVFVLGSGELARLPLRIAAGEVRDIEIALAEAGRMRGTVRDAGGQPVGGATIDVRSLPVDVVKRSVKSANGTGAFDVRDLYPGRYVVVAKHGTRVSEAIEVSIGVAHTLEGVDLIVR